MNWIWTESIDAILSIGRPLESIGIRNWALDRHDALTALKRLSKAKVSMLGGDVYELKGQNLVSNYDNWYCNRKENESDEDFINRSIQVAEKFITNYQPGNVFFALVPGVNPESSRPLSAL